MKIEELNRRDKIFLARYTTNRKLLKVLVKENDEFMNYIIAKNENTPLELLEKLNSQYIYKKGLNMKIEELNKKDKIVLARYTTNRELLKFLVKENDEIMNCIIAKNENTPLEVLKNLSSNDRYKKTLNENYFFKKYLNLMSLNVNNFSKIETIEQEAIVKMFRMIDKKEYISIEQCNIILDINYDFLLSTIASYERTPIEFLNKLYDLDPNKYDLSLAQNQECPKNLFEKLANHKGKYIKYLLLFNKNCPEEISEKLYLEVDKNKIYNAIFEIIK